MGQKKGNPYQDKEAEVMDHTLKAWSAFTSLDQTHPDDMIVIREAVHVIQGIIMQRVIRRDYPDHFATGSYEDQANAIINEIGAEASDILKRRAKGQYKPAPDTKLLMHSYKPGLKELGACLICKLPKTNPIHIREDWDVDGLVNHTDKDCKGCERGRYWENCDIWDYKGGGCSQCEYYKPDK